MIGVSQQTQDSILKGMSEELLNSYQRWQRALDYHNRSLTRSLDNWRFYWGLDPELGYGQWPSKVVGEMLTQNRQLATYNFVKPVVDTIAGGIIQAPFEPEFYPVNDEITSLTEAIKRAMYSDRELMDWDITYYQMVMHGLIYEGVMKMVVSDEYDELGNIGFDICLPGSVLASPFWTSPRSKECRQCFKESFYTVDKACEIWEEKTDWLKSRSTPFNADKANIQYGAYSGPTPFLNSDSSSLWGTAHRFIEEYTMERKKVVCEYAVSATGDVQIPKELKEPHQKINWLNMNVPDWDPEYIYEKPKWEEQCIVKTMCPSLSQSEYIENGPTEIQIGRLPFFWWSASRVNGQPQSIVDSVKDFQMNLNYLESLITHKWQIEGGGGSQFYDEESFADKKEADRFKRDRGNPRAMFKTRPGLLAEGKTPAVPTSHSNMPIEAYEHLNHLISVVLPHISKVTPAQRGQQEGQQSGYLYNLMREQSEQQLRTIYYGLRLFWNEVYEAYLLQAANTYSNEGIPRSFPINHGTETLTLNEPVILPDGRQGIRNDVSKLKNIRHKVIISEKPSTPTAKLQKVAVYSELINSLGPSSSGSRQLMINEIVRNIDNIDQEVRDQLEAVGNEELDAVMEQIGLQKASARVQRLQAEQMAMGLEQQIMAQNMAAYQGQAQPNMLQGTPSENMAPEQGPMNPETLNNQQPVAMPQANQQDMSIQSAPQGKSIDFNKILQAKGSTL